MMNGTARRIVLKVQGNKQQKLMQKKIDEAKVHDYSFGEIEQDAKSEKLP
jgi:hypothetical protein